jgi:hypothetical protein
MNANNSEYELIRQEIFRIGAKLDTLPQVYVTRIEYDPWRNSVEKRFDEIDKLKSESSRWVMEERTRINDQIQQTERHLQEKLDKNIDQVGVMHDKLAEKIDNKLESHVQSTWTWRQTWIVFGASTFVGIAEFIINYLLTRH